MTIHPFLPNTVALGFWFQAAWTRCFRYTTSRWVVVAAVVKAVAPEEPPAYVVSTTPAAAELFGSPVSRRCLWLSLR